MPWAHNEYIGSKRIAGSIEITDEQYSQALEALGEDKRISIENGVLEFLDPPEPETPPPPPEPSIEDYRSMGKAYVDGLAEGARAKYITLGAGQAMTYLQKAQEAKTYLETSDPVDSNFPLLSAEVGVTGNNVLSVATVVNDAFTQWQQIGGAIEAVRLSAKAAIATAADKEAIQSIIDGAVWP